MSSAAMSSVLQGIFGFAELQILIKETNAYSPEGAGKSLSEYSNTFCFFTSGHEQSTISSLLKHLPFIVFWHFNPCLALLKHSYSDEMYKEVNNVLHMTIWIYYKINDIFVICVSACFVF